VNLKNVVLMLLVIIVRARATGGDASAAGRRGIGEAFHLVQSPGRHVAVNDE
jgi:hypothetical protein